MKIDDKTGLVLEGGGMRGVFTCGVLDYMMDKKVWFPYGVGVSAGACNGLSYMSRQRGRAKFSNIDLLEKYHYIGIKHLWRKHSILDQELLYEHFPKEILPYDYKTYAENRSYFRIRKCSEKEAVFRNVLEKAVRKKKTKVFFKHAPRNNEMKGFIL